MDYGFEVFVLATCWYISCLRAWHSAIKGVFFILIALLREPTGVFSFHFKEFEAACKARKALEIYFQSHKTLKSSYNTYKWTQPMFQVLIRHSFHLCKHWLSSQIVCPEHCYEKSRCGWDCSKACGQYLGISEQVAPHRWNVHVWRLVAAARQERREKAREGFLWQAELYSPFVRCWAVAGRTGHFQSQRSLQGCRLTLSWSDWAVWPSWVSKI